MTDATQVEVIDLGSCDHAVQFEQLFVPSEHGRVVGLGVSLEKPCLRVTIQSQKYGNRTVECVDGVCMDLETWAEVNVLV